MYVTCQPCSLSGSWIHWNFHRCSGYHTLEGEPWSRPALWLGFCRNLSTQTPWGGAGTSWDACRPARWSTRWCGDAAHRSASPMGLRSLNHGHGGRRAKPKHKSGYLGFSNASKHLVGCHIGFLQWNVRVRPPYYGLSCGIRGCVREKVIAQLAHDWTVPKGALWLSWHNWL